MHVLSREVDNILISSQSLVFAFSHQTQMAIDETCPVFETSYRAAVAMMPFGVAKPRGTLSLWV